jgi:hypothetical protein
MTNELYNKIQVIYAIQNYLHTEMLRLMGTWAESNMKLDAQSQAIYGLDGSPEVPSARSGATHKSEQLSGSIADYDNALTLTDNAVNGDIEYTKGAFSGEFNRLQVRLTVVF